MGASEEIDIQRQYYAETAHRYDSMHVNKDDEHYLALSFLVAAVDYLNVDSVLDLGSGTGRAIRYLKERCPGLRILGIEPVEELRNVGYSHGIAHEELVDGDATALEYEASEFDLVCEFGALHHIRRPDLAVSEMLRVANKAIFISDTNNFGQGSATARRIKQMLNLVGLWKVANFIKTKGKGYLISEGDGLAYSYSVFNNYRQIRRHCNRVHILDTGGGHINPYTTTSHVALLGIKK